MNLLPYTRMDNQARQAMATTMRNNSGLLTVREASVHGIHRRALSRAVERGELTRLRTRVYAPTGLELNWHAELAADLKACKADAWAAFEAALKLHGLAVKGTGTRRELIVTGTARPTVAGDVVVHRTTGLHPVDQTIVHGIPVTTAERTLVDMARRLTVVQRLGLLDDAIMSDIAERDVIFDRSCVLSNGRKGVATLIQATAPGAEARFKSRLEKRGAPLVKEAGIADARVNVIPLDAPNAGLTDVVSESLKIIIDWDGLRFHRDRHARQRDNDKSNAAVLGGYLALRFTWYDVVMRPAYVVATVRRAVEAQARRRF